MNKFIKIVTVFVITAIFVGCAVDNREGRFPEDPTSGWVQFRNPATTTIFIETLVEDQVASAAIPFRLTAPINTSDLAVNYSIVNVVGNASSVVNTSGTAIVEANTTTGEIILNFNLGALANDPFTGYTFDVVLTGTDRSTVGVGVAGDSSFPTTFRVVLSAPCFTPNIAGTFSFASTSLQSGPGGGCPGGTGTANGSVTWTEISPAVYSVSDASFGLFASCWNDAPATGPRLNLLCNVLSVSGSDQYGDTYTYTIVSINGTALTIEWENTYGDGGTTVLTRTDGEDWPDLVN